MRRHELLAISSFVEVHHNSANCPSSVPVHLWKCRKKPNGPAAVVFVARLCGGIATLATILSKMFFEKPIRLAVSKNPAMWQTFDPAAVRRSLPRFSTSIGMFREAAFLRQ
jgi:hypothetical protein